MTTNKKGRPGRHQATLKRSKSTCYFTDPDHRIRAFIITLALWGCLAVWLAGGGV